MHCHTCNHRPTKLLRSTFHAIRQISSKLHVGGNTLQVLDQSLVNFITADNRHYIILYHKSGLKCERNITKISHQIMKEHGTYHFSFTHHLHDFFISGVIKRASLQIVYKIISIFGTCVSSIPELLYITGCTVSVKTTKTVVCSHITGIRRKLHIAVENKLSKISITVKIAVHHFGIYPIEGTVDFRLFIENSFTVVLRYRVNIQKVTASCETQRSQSSEKQIF